MLLCFSEKADNLFLILLQVFDDKFAGSAIKQMIQESEKRVWRPGCEVNAVLHGHKPFFLGRLFLGAGVFFEYAHPIFVMFFP